MRRRLIAILGHPLTTLLLLVLTLLSLALAVDHVPAIRIALQSPTTSAAHADEVVAAFSFLYRTPDGPLLLSADDHLELWPAFNDHRPLGEIDLLYSPSDQTYRVRYPTGLTPNEQSETRRLVADAYFTRDRYGNRSVTQSRDRFLQSGEFVSPREDPDITWFKLPSWLAPTAMVALLTLTCLATLASLVLLARRRFKGTRALLASPWTIAACVIALGIDLNDIGYDQFFRNIDTTIGRHTYKYTFPKGRRIRVDPYFEDLLLAQRPDGSVLVTLPPDARQLGWRPPDMLATAERVVILPRRIATGVYAGTLNELRLSVSGPYSDDPSANAEARGAALAFYRHHFLDDTLITDADIRQARADADAPSPIGPPQTILRYPRGPRPIGYLRDALSLGALATLLTSIILILTNARRTAMRT